MESSCNLCSGCFRFVCLYVTLFASWLEEYRLTSFVAFIVFLGYLIFPAKKGQQKVNYMPWYDIVLMILGTGAFLYYTANAMTIIQQGSNFREALGIDQNRAKNRLLCFQ